MRILKASWNELLGGIRGDLAGRVLDIESRTEEAIRAEFAQLSRDEIDCLLEVLRARRGSLATGAAYNNEIISISKQILAFGGAGLGIVAAFAKSLSDLPSAILKPLALLSLFYVDLTILSLFTIIQFVWLTRIRYPFLYLQRIGNTVPYFYYRTISPEVPRHLILTADEKVRSIELYAADLVRFIRYHLPQRTDGAPNPPDNHDAGLKLKRRELQDELQQYFLLISYQGYVNQFEVRMNNCFLYGLIASILSTLVVGITIYLRK